MTRLRSILEELDAKGWLTKIDVPLDIELEIPHLAYVEAKKEHPKVLLFTHPVSKSEKRSLYSSTRCKTV